MVLRTLFLGASIGGSFYLLSRDASASQVRLLAVHTAVAMLATALLRGGGGGSGQRDDGEDGDMIRVIEAVASLEGLAVKDEREEFLQRRLRMLARCKKQLSGKPPLLPLAIVPAKEVRGDAAAPTGDAAAFPQHRVSTLNVLTWNILAQRLFSVSGFSLAADGVGDADFRRWRIFEVLASAFFDASDPSSSPGADVICLQELDKYHEWLMPMLGYIGYEGVFSRGGGVGDGVDEDGGPSLKRHGVAVFYRAQKLELLGVHRTVGKYNPTPNSTWEDDQSFAEDAPRGDDASYRGCFVKLRRRDADEAASRAREPFVLEVQSPHAASLAAGETRVHLRTYPLPPEVIAKGMPMYVLQSPRGGMVYLDAAAPPSPSPSQPSPLVVGVVTFSRCVKYESREQFEADAPLHGVAPLAPAAAREGRGSLDLYALMAGLEGGAERAEYRAGEPNLAWSPSRPMYGWVVSSAVLFPPDHERRVFVSPERLRRRYRSIYQLSAARHVVVATCHLNSDKDEAGALQRRRQMQRMLSELRGFCGLADLAGGAVDGDCEVILAGDFNAQPDEDCVREATAGGLREAYGGGRGAFDATSYKARTGDFKRGVHRYWIDYMFSSRRLRASGLLRLPLEASAAYGRALAQGTAAVEALWRREGTAGSLRGARDNAEERRVADAVAGDMRRILRAERSAGGAVGATDREVEACILRNDSLPCYAWPSDHWAIAAAFELSSL